MLARRRKKLGWTRRLNGNKVLWIFSFFEVFPKNLLNIQQYKIESTVWLKLSTVSLQAEILIKQKILKRVNFLFVRFLSLSKNLRQK
ncbi:hypothetical protein C4F40_18485 [Sphingobacterium sp. Ka21]|uniref:Uncharacterized protein n=1 Tax=Sphingobacterium pedocola TaxID=2082722 RepID=A0ABR9TBI1_9SPHI|nr:hypothetical protein [Sphingobacterium pedocola]